MTVIFVADAREKMDELVGLRKLPWDTSFAKSVQDVRKAVDGGAIDKVYLGSPLVGTASEIANLLAYLVPAPEIVILDESRQHTMLLEGIFTRHAVRYTVVHSFQE